MPLVNFQTHGYCQLNCTFCLYGDKSIKKLTDGWTLENFKPVADKLLEMGVDRFDMTPSLGEVFVNPDLWKMLDYIDGRASYIQMYTHGIGVGIKHLVNLRNMKSPVTLFFSVYGDDKEGYQNVTGHDKFEDFLFTIKVVKALLPLPKNIRIGFDIRFTEIELPLKVTNIPLTNPLWRELLVISQQEENIIITNKWENSNWGINFDGLSNAKPHVPLTGTCDCCAVTLNPNGDAVICDICHPLDERFDLLGNVFTDDPKVIYNRINEVMVEMSRGVFPAVCHNCTEYTCNGDIEDYFDGEWKTRTKRIWNEDTDS